MDNKNAGHHFLAGGGEMGELIRGKDWGKTPLGDPGTWPQSLQTMVAIMLDNPFGMYIAWGDGYIQLYNDGYRPILGANKHPLALGISTRETFSEIWENIIGSMFDGVMKGNAVGYPDLMLPLNRNGFVEECYFDFSYSPIRNNDGTVGGVLVTVIETTDKKKAQLALNESNNQLQFAIDAAELGTWDYDPATDKFTCNHRMKAWFGLSAGAGIALHHATDIIVEKDRNRIIKAIETALDHSSGGSYEEEFSIINPVNNNMIIFQVKGKAWFNEEKIAYRFTGTLQEVTENVLARKKREESEEQLRIAIEGGEFGTFDFFPQTNQLIWSDKTKELFGLPADAAVSYETYLAALHPEDSGTSRAIAHQQAHLKDGDLYELEYRTIGITDGRSRWLRSKGKATYDDKGEPIRYTGVIQDITKQREASEILRQSDRRFRDTVMQAPVGICILRGPRYIVEMANDAYLQLVDKKEAGFVGNPLFDTLPEVEEAVHSLLDNVLDTGMPYHGNEVAIPVNRYGKQDVSYFDFLYHPLKEEDGKISGVMAIVTEVTEKVEARKTIEERKRLYETITQNTPDLIYVFGLDYRFSYANEALLKMWGRTWEDAVGKGMLEIGYEPWHAEMHEREIDHVIATKKPVRGEVSFPHATLGKRTYDYILVPVIDGDGQVEAIAGTTRDITNQVETRKQIEESEQRFQAAIQAVQGILWTNNAKGEMEGEQPGWATLTGQTYGEYQGYGWTQAVHPDDARPTLDAWNEAVKERRTFIFEHRLRTKDREWRDFSIRAIPLLNADGTLLQWVGVHTDITENKLAAKALKANEEKLTIVIEASGLGMYELNLLTDEVVYSDKYLGILGFSKGIVPTHKELINRLHPNEIQTRNRAFEDSMVSGTLFYQARVVWDDKTMHWIEVKGKVFYDEENSPIKLIGTVGDITDEKVQKQALQESEERFRAMADNISQLAWMTDEKGQMTWYNKRWLEYSGTTMEQMLDEGAKHMHHPEHRSRVIDKYLKAVEDGKEWEDTFPLLGTDGQYRWFLSRAITIKDADGKVKQWFGTNTDITGLMEAEAALKESEEKFRLLADSMPQHIWTSDPQGNLNYYNKSVFDYSGLTPEEINKNGWIQIVHPDDREENIKQWLDAVSSGEDFLLEHRFRRHDGEYRWQLSRAIPQKDKNGAIQMWVGTSTDIQEQKTFAQALESQVSQRTKELEASNTELQKKNKELESFAYISSHDLQEPLRKIQAFASRILEKEENNLSGTGKDHFKRMQAAAQRMQALVQDLLAYSRTGTAERKPEATDLNKIIMEVREDLWEELGQKQATIEADVPCDADIIPFQFRQLMLNLIGNSLKFSRPGVPPRIRIIGGIAYGNMLDDRLLPDKRYCHITVSDNGIGFEQRYSEKIFEVFQRLHGKSEYEGTGIGLSIVKKIVDNHNGMITASGETGKGAAFHIYIPAMT